MRILLAFPPQFDPTMPYLSLPCLTAVLRQAGHEVIQKDVNVELYDRLFTTAEITRATEWLCQERAAPQNRGLPSEEVDAALNAAPLITHLVESAREALRQAESCYDYARYSGSLKVLDQALRLFSLVYHPTRLSLYGFLMARSPYSTAYVLQAVRNEQENPFLDLYRRYTLPEIVAAAPQVVGISITFEEQIIPGLTLAQLVKEQLPEAHVVIGATPLPGCAMRWWITFPCLRCSTAWSSMRTKRPC